MITVESEVYAAQYLYGDMGKSYIDCKVLIELNDDYNSVVILYFDPVLEENTYRVVKEKELRGV